MEFQRILYENFIKSLGKELVEVKEEERKPSSEGQVRLFFLTPPEFALVLKKEEDLSVVVPLTSYLQLAITNLYPPLIKWRKYNLVPLPFWIYVNETLLQEYSVPMFVIKEKEGLERIREYIKSARVKGIGKWREKFIRKSFERWQDINLSSILYKVEND